MVPRSARAAVEEGRPPEKQAPAANAPSAPDATEARAHRDPLTVLASASSLVANLRWVHSDRVDLAEIGRYHEDLFQRGMLVWDRGQNS